MKTKPPEPNPQGSMLELAMYIKKITAENRKKAYTKAGIAVQ